MKKTNAKCPNCQVEIDLEINAIASPHNPAWLCPSCGVRLEKDLSLYFHWKLAFIIAVGTFSGSIITYLIFNASENIATYIGLTVAVIWAWIYAKNKERLVIMQ